MLRDITIGQHFPGDSLVHKFDPRMKLVLTIVYIILLFAASNPLGLTLSLVFLVAMYGVAKIPFKLITKSLKPILPIILFTAVLNLFFVSGEGEPLVHFWVLNIYAEGLRYAILMAVRVMALIAGTSLLTYTTSPIVLTDAIEQLLKPLGRLHFPVHELAMMIDVYKRQMVHILLSAGHETVADLGEADVILVNTCGFIAVSYTHLDVYKRQAARAWKKSWQSWTPWASS